MFSAVSLVSPSGSFFLNFEILMPPTFHIPHFNRYTTELFRGTQKVDLVSTACHPPPFKGRISRKLFLILVHFNPIHPALFGPFNTQGGGSCFPELLEGVTCSKKNLQLSSRKNLQFKTHFWCPSSRDIAV